MSRPAWTQAIPRGVRTRFAPAPTGFLHLGHLVNALFVWGIARSRQGTVIGRIEDHDRQRSRPEYEAAIMEDLAWLGLEPDEPWTRQSEHTDRYERMLELLGTRARIYACDCSRNDIRRRGGQTDGAEIVYDGYCRDRGLSPGPNTALRLEWPPARKEEPEFFQDFLLGEQSQSPDEQCGDPVLRDGRGNWSYHYAVSADDYRQRVDLVIRGGDLLDSTARQIRLARLMGRKQAPRFLHHPLLIGADGRKLSKSHGSRGIRELRRRGRGPEQVLGLAAWAAGLQPRPDYISAAQIIELFS